MNLSADTLNERCKIIYEEGFPGPKPVIIRRTVRRKHKDGCTRMDEMKEWLFDRQGQAWCKSGLNEPLRVTKDDKVKVNRAHREEVVL